MLTNGYCHDYLCSSNIGVMPRRGSVPFFLFALLVLDAVLLRPPAAGAPIQSDAAKTETSSATAHPVLIELFTSEGCSSCPPVDALVQNGWKDPNSSAALTERQSAYVRVLGLSTPYTPQLIVDGTIEVHANEAQRLEQVLRNAATTPRIGVRIGELSVDSGDSPVIRAHVDTDTNLEKHNADVLVAVALDHVESQVLHGENGGRRLTHVAVVQQLTKIGKLQKGKTFAEDVQLKLKPGTDPKNVRLIVFVQEGGPGRLLGAALRKPTS